MLGLISVGDSEQAVRACRLSGQSVCWAYRTFLLVVSIDTDNDSKNRN